ncbi:MAG: hypothetical protein KAI73_12195 [Rhodospirillaceae bacterium]|nr:hypothetical protein [Rhodospirillaceae bacterium]
MSTEIMLVENLKAVDIFGGDNKLDPILDKLEKEVKSFYFDISTSDGRKSIASLAHKVARTKTALDGMGKGLTDAARVQMDAINLERRTMRDRLDELKEEVRKPLTDWENKEKDRIKDHEESLATLLALAEFPDQTPTSQEIEERISALSELHTQRQWEEFETPANNARNDAEQKLSKMRDERKQYEDEQEELARLRKENEEREIKEREERIASEAAEKAKIEAEEKAKLEAEAAETKAREEREEMEQKAKAGRDESERLRLEAEEKAKVAEQAKKDAEKKAEQAAQKERDRIADEKAAEEKATQAREADKKHRAKINNEALGALKAVGLSEADSKLVVESVAKQQIPNIVINY